MSPPPASCIEGSWGKAPEVDGMLVLQHTFLRSPGGFYTLVSYSLPTVPR